ncbi:MAG: hypothetical protein KJZ77_00170 [Anaerolineales bacterium]|nr:hypothetical protein [Anaerolineales bacterium]
MARSATIKKRVSQARSSVKPSDILNFSSAIIAVIASAIFYFAGWVYVSHWYSFFGVDASQLDLPTPIILIHGVPGILTILGTGFAAVSLFSISKHATKRRRVNAGDTPNIIIIAYLLSFIVLVVLALFAYGNLNFSSFPIEVSISIIAVIILLFALDIFEQSIDVAAGRGYRFLRIAFFEIGFFPRWLKPARFYLWSKMIYSAVEKRDYKLIFDIVFIKNVSLVKQLDAQEKKFLEVASKQQAEIRKATSQTSQFWVGAFVILYFLISISVSSIFGEWDAKLGRKSMVGGWQVEATYIYSNKNIVLALPVDQSKTTSEITAYGPLMLLGKNEDNYFFTEWTNKFPIKDKPNVYMVKITDNTSVGMSFLAPTPTPTPTSYTTKVPTVFSTPTPIPTSTMATTP